LTTTTINPFSWNGVAGIVIYNPGSADEMYWLTGAWTD
jgi:hypothetical protein